jgi:hypothetical protein
MRSPSSKPDVMPEPILTSRWALPAAAVTRLEESEPMATKPKKPLTRWFNGSTPLTELGPTERLAHEIVSTYADLAPSVEKIMSAELADDDRHTALASFQTALGSPGDPNRDPRVAIANATSGGSATPE